MAETTSVLLIEDNDGDARLVRSHLEVHPTPFVVEHQSTLTQGLRRLSEGRFAVVLLDLGLPGCQGMEALYRVLEACPKTPVVVLSGVSDRATALQAVKAGAQDCLTKDDLDGQVLSRALQYAVERKRIQSALAVEEARFRSVAEHAFDGILAADHDGHVTYMNPFAASAFGCTDGPPAGLSLGDLLVDAEGPEAMLPLDRRLRTDPDHVLDTPREMVGVRQDGGRFPVEVSITGWTGEAGREYTVLVHDMTRRRDAEKALADHRYQLATAAELAHIGAWTLYVDEGRMTGSPEFDRILGTTLPRDEQTFTAFLELVHETDRERLDAAMRRCTEDGVPMAAECRIVRPSGAERHIEIRAGLFSAPTEPRRIVGTLQDVTERHDSASALEEYYRQLVKTEKLAALGTLIAGVAHEINNPLAYVKNNEQILAALLRRATENGRIRADPHDEKDLTGRILKLLDTNRTGIERIETIVRSLRQVARPSSGRREAVDIFELTRDTLPVLKPVRDERGVRITLEEPVEHDEVMGSQGELSQVILNLTKNALEATPEGGTVRISFRREDGWVCLDVVDEGEGVPKELAGRIFNPFFTTKSTGTGLGLAISGQVADAHGGMLESCNTAEGGARFTLRLPDKDHAPTEVPDIDPMDIRILGRGAPHGAPRPGT